MQWFEPGIVIIDTSQTKQLSPDSEPYIKIRTHLDETPVLPGSNLYRSLLRSPNSNPIIRNTRSNEIDFLTGEERAFYETLRIYVNFSEQPNRADELFRLNLRKASALFVIPTLFICDSRATWSGSHQLREILKVSIMANLKAIPELSILGNVDDLLLCLYLKRRNQYAIHGDTVYYGFNVYLCTADSIPPEFRAETRPASCFDPLQQNTLFFHNFDIPASQPSQDSPFWTTTFFHAKPEVYTQPQPSPYAVGPPCNTHSDEDITIDDLLDQIFTEG